MNATEQEYILDALDIELKSVDELYKCAGNKQKASYYKGMHDMIKNVKLLIENINLITIPIKANKIT